jgi:hypothetical protein
MRSLTELPKDKLKVAHDATEALMEHKAYLPPGGLLFMLVGRYRDDIREILGMQVEDLPQRGKERRSLDELTTVELDTLSGAVTILLEARFTSAMGDPALPKLLREFDGDLNTQKTERAQLRASIAS